MHLEMFWSETVENHERWRMHTLSLSLCFSPFPSSLFKRKREKWILLSLSLSYVAHSFSPSTCATRVDIKLFFFSSSILFFLSFLFVSVTLVLAHASDKPDRLPRRAELKCLKCVGKGHRRSAILSSMPLRFVGEGCECHRLRPLF